MKWRSSLILYICLLILLVLLNCIVQSSLWPLIWNFSGSPLLWLSLLIYLIIYRKSWVGLISGYLILGVVLNFTSINPKTLFMSYLVVFAILTVVKSRIFWTGPVYFALMNIVGIISFHLTTIIGSYLFDPSPTSVFFIARFLDIIFTAPFAYLIYKLMFYMDTIFFQDWASEPKAEI